MAIDNRKMGMRIFLGIVIFIIGASMLIYLVPQTPGTGEAATDAVATVGGESVTLADIRQQMASITRRQSIPKQLESLYAQQILKQLIFQKEIEYEAKRLGIRVSDQEVSDRIKQFLPSAFTGDTPVKMDEYAAQVQSRFQMPVPEFERLIRQALLEEKFQKLVTDGISVGPTDLEQEFRYRNDKVKLAYVQIRPEDLETKIAPTEAETAAYYEKNRQKYQIPEKRVVHYGLLPDNRQRAQVQVTDAELEAEYKRNLQQYQVPNRVHVAHILLMTVGKPDAVVEEVRKQAEQVLQQAKKGGNFAELAKKYSEDPGSKDKGGDLGFIVQGQTVAEFEKAAFSLPPGSVSDLVKTQYGFHIIKVMEKESAHTQSLAEVREALMTNLLATKTQDALRAESDRLGAAVRKSSKVTMEDLAKEFPLLVADTRPVSAVEPILEFGNAPEVKDEIFRLRPGQLSAPLRTDRGAVVLSIKEIQPPHQGTLLEVHDKVLADLKQEKAVEMARLKAEDLVKRMKAGEKFDAAAKSLGLAAKTSDPLARNGSLPGVASGKQLGAAFPLKVGEVGTPLNLGNSWVVYQVAEKQTSNMADFEKQKKDLLRDVVQAKKQMAFEAFRAALDNRLKEEGNLKMMPDKLKGFGSFS